MSVNFDAKLYDSLIAWAKVCIANNRKHGQIFPEDVVADVFLLIGIKTEEEYKKIIGRKIKGESFQRVTKNTHEEKMKCCTKCKEDLPGNSFRVQKRKNGSLYLHPWCKECCRSYRKAYYEKNKPEILKKNKVKSVRYRAQPHVKKVLTSPRYKAKRKEARVLLKTTNPEKYHALMKGRNARFRSKIKTDPDKYAEYLKNARSYYYKLDSEERKRRRKEKYEELKADPVAYAKYLEQMRERANKRYREKSKK